MWNQIKELELVFMKLGEKTKRLKRVKSHLQGYLDELCWRCENRELDSKRESLISVLGAENWMQHIQKVRKNQEKVLKKYGVECGPEEKQNVGKMYDEVMKKCQKGRIYDTVNTGKTQQAKDAQSVVEDDDPISERKRIFGDKSDSSSSSSEQDEDEDEFMIVMQAVRERKKLEAEVARLPANMKLSQTGWKLKNQFRPQPLAIIDERDRVDLLENGLPKPPTQVIAAVQETTQ